MGYFKAKADLTLVRQFGDNVHAYLLESQNLLEALDYGPVPRATNRWQESRVFIAQNVDLIDAICDRLNIAYIANIRAPMGATHHNRNISMFRAILVDDPIIKRVLPPQTVIDALNSLLASCERDVARELHRLWNPFYWLLELLTFILRIPFLIIQTSGFHVEKFEEQLWGRIFKLFELATLVLFLLWVGASKPDIKDIVLSTIHAGKYAASEKSLDKGSDTGGKPTTSIPSQPKK